MYGPMSCCRLNLSPAKCLVLKCRHNNCSVSVVLLLRLLAMGISLLTMYWSTLSLTLSPAFAEAASRRQASRERGSTGYTSS